MTLPALVLVHGGEHAADLPGRRGKPGDLATATIAEWAGSVVDDIATAGLDDVVIAGHSMAGEPVDRGDLPDDVPRTWILTTRDRALSVRSQRRSIAAFGGVQTVLPIDACHDVMISHPRWLAETFIERCSRWQ